MLGALYYEFQIRNEESNADSGTINEQIEEQSLCLAEVDSRINQCISKVCKQLFCVFFLIIPLAYMPMGI